MNELERLVKRCNEMDITEQQNYLGDAILPTLAAEELAEIRKHTEWQPIETAPKDGEPIIGYGKHNIFQCFWNNKLKEWVLDDEHGDMFVKPPYWMPLPSIPEERAG